MVEPIVSDQPTERDFFDVTHAVESRLCGSPVAFDTTIKVAGLTVATGTVTGGMFPDETCVALLTFEEHIALSPAEARDLAAALTVLALHIEEDAA